MVLSLSSLYTEYIIKNNCFYIGKDFVILICFQSFCAIVFMRCINWQSYLGQVGGGCFEAGGLNKDGVFEAPGSELSASRVKNVLRSSPRFQSSIVDIQFSLWMKKNSNGPKSQAS